jgi:Putative zinc-finger
VDCVDVRERLTEHALGTLPSEEGSFVDRHLDWCAGCRKEAAGLGRAAATVGYSVPQSGPPLELEERIVRRIRSAAGAAPPTRRRLRALSLATAAALLLAALGVGFGLTMFAQGQRDRNQAQQAIEQSREITSRLERLLGGLLKDQPGQGPRDRIVRTQLAPGPGHQGGAGAVVYLSPNINDWALVVVGGLARSGAPYHVTLQDRYGGFLTVGSIAKLHRDGSGAVYREFGRTLRPYAYVLVKDHAGRIVLSGDLDYRRPAAVPT